MRYFSTRSRSCPASFAEAALTGLAPDGGLYVPEAIPQYRPSVRNSLGTMAFQDVAFETIQPYVHQEISDSVLGEIIASAYPFGAPLVPVGDRMALELFHGPTAAFKDFGARFMARAFAYLRRGESRPLKILVATSGDTGGAVADGFFGIEGISVTVLYPQGRVTPLQEKQIAGLGGNVSAAAVKGSFDDCQALVKAAFADGELRKAHTLSSANSINISRLIPQAVYYAAAAGLAFAGKTSADGAATPRTGQHGNEHIVAHNTSQGRNRELRMASAGLPVCFCVPSGNFGNLTAGIYAMKMGAPISGFIAATNVNKAVPDYLENGNYEARPSQATISNAMDVGSPSNFERMSSQWTYSEMKAFLKGASVSDEATRETIVRVFEKFGYFLDPHGAVGWRAADDLEKSGRLGEGPLAVLGTAHPAKFAEVVEPLTGPVPAPASLLKAMERTAQAVVIPNELDALKGAL